MIAVAATLLAAAFAAAPAWGDDTGATGPSPTIVDSLSASSGNNAGSGAMIPPHNPVDTTAPADNGQSTPAAPQNNAATNTQTTTTTGGDGGTATGGNAGPSQVVGHGSQGGSRGGNASANGGDAKSHSSLENEQSNQISGRDGFGPAHRGDARNNQGGQNSSVLEATKPRDSGGAAAGTYHTRFPALFGLGAASHAIRLEAQERRGHETAKVSPLGGGLPGQRDRLPGQNPFFSILSGPGGAEAGLLLLILLAVLAASFALPNECSKALRTRTAMWRPLAYVPPIELPG